MAEDARYRLAGVRDARARAEKDRQAELAAAVGDAGVARKHLEGLRSRTHVARAALARAIEERAALLGRAAVPALLVNADRFITRRRHELDAALGEELRAEAAFDAKQGEVDLQRRILARARAEREVVDRHFAAWRQARKKLAERRTD